MRARSVWGEAWRNLVTGTSRAGALAAVFALAFGLLAFADVRSVATILQGARTFQDAGAAVAVLKSGTPAVDGGRCDATAGTGAIRAAGALRTGEPTTFAVMPSAHVATVEATPGLLGLLPVVARPVGRDPRGAGGVWLSADLAAALGAAPGATLQTSSGPATVAGTYTWPDDGRARDLAYTVITPVPAVGPFTQCWAQTWPAGDGSNLIFTTLTPAGTAAQVTLGQLNSTLGLRYDTQRLLDGRLTAATPWVAVGVGLVLGMAAIRARRLEIASSLHARVPRMDLTAQHVVEAAAWAASASLIVAAVLTWAARSGSPGPGWTTVWDVGLRTVAAAVAATVLGTVAGLALTRERHLFRYTKDGGR